MSSTAPILQNIHVYYLNPKQHSLWLKELVRLLVLFLPSDHEIRVIACAFQSKALVPVSGSVGPEINVRENSYLI
jgi:hypothetical protein